MGSSELYLGKEVGAAGGGEEVGHVLRGSDGTRCYGRGEEEGGKKKRGVGVGGGGLLFSTGLLIFCFKLLLLYYYYC